MEILKVRKGITTIQIKDETKKNLDKAKVHPRETYDDVISRLLAGKESK